MISTSSRTRWFGLAIGLVFLVAGISLGKAQEPSIDNLLKRLPPPEKLVKTPVQRVLQQKDPALGDPLGKKIVFALQQGNLGSAIDFSRQLVQHYPHSPAAHLLLGVLLADSRRFADGVAEVHQAIAIKSDFALGYFVLGQIEVAQKHFTAALPHYQEAAELDAKNPIAWIFVSVCADQLGRREQAQTAAQRATNASPAFLPAWLQLARAEKELGHTSECLHAILRAADLSPDSAYMLSTVGYAYINLDRIPEAVAPLQRAARFAPNDFLVQSQFGFCLLTTGQTDAAIEHLRKGAKLAPSYAPVWEHLGLAYAKQGRHRDAVSSFERATKLKPDYQQAWHHLADEYRIVGRPADAQQAAARADNLKSAWPAGAKKKA